MATQKSITAYDIQQGQLSLIRKGSDINIIRRYWFEDNVGEIIQDMARGQVSETIPIASIPANIVIALQDIDDWTYQKALVQEGMND